MQKNDAGLSTGSARKSGHIVHVLGCALQLVLASLPFVPQANAEDDPAIDCDNAQTQQEMNFCAGQDFDKADAALNMAWKKAKAAMTEADKSVAEFDAAQVGAVDSLVKAQRGWIDYRDGQCEDYAFQSRGGTMEPLLLMSCKADLTKIRTKELLDLTEQGN